MINTADILETIGMIREENLDIRTITMGISLFDCVSDDEDRLCQKIYDKITKKAGNLVKTGEEIAKDYGIPIVNKRVSVTPVSLVGGALSPDGYMKLARTLDRAADEVGINFIGGYSALVHKGMTPSERNLISVIPEALAETGKVCSSVNVATTKAGIKAFSLPRTAMEPRTPDLTTTVSQIPLNLSAISSGESSPSKAEASSSLAKSRST